MNLSIKENIIEWIKAIVFGILIFIIVRTFLFSNYIVEGESMLPTLREGNKLVVNKLSYNIGSIERFDVIVFHATVNEDYVKRVIGLPGDKIEYRQDTLHINGTKYDEDYLDELRVFTGNRNITGDFSLYELTGSDEVPEGMLFVLGDNRLGSWDSRHFGFVSIDDVVGKVKVRYWPLNEFVTSF